MGRRILWRLGAGVYALAAVCAYAQSPAPHWSLVPPRRPELPALAANDSQHGPVDAFIQERLARENLSPSPTADRRILIRRVMLALSGLAPTPEEIETFLADSSPDAFERLVDRLLASPRYGERMAADWLDLARYADTHGYHSDSERVMWPWRDWVIDALNCGMPYDQFTVEQLAGDLLPRATLSQRVATGLSRNHMLNDENGAIPAEYLAEYVADRVATTGTIWLGLTLSCARCHDHKYDRITQREFYQLFAFFHNVPENGLGGKTGNAPPIVVAPTRLQQAELDRLAATIASLEQRLSTRAAAGDADLERWERKAAGVAGKAKTPGDAAVHFRFDETQGTSAGCTGTAPAAGRIKGHAAWVGGKFGGALLLNGETHVEVPGLPHQDRAAAFSIAAWVFPTTRDAMTIAGRVDEPQSRRGWELGIAGGQIALRLTHTAGTDEIEVRAPLAFRRAWQHVAATYDGSGKAQGIAIYLDGQLQKVEIVRDSLTGHIQGDQALTIGRGDERTFFRGMLDEVQLFPRALAAEETAALAGGDPIAETLATPRAQRSAPQQAAVKRHYLEYHDPVYKAAFAELTLSKASQQALLRAAPTTMVMEELREPRPTFVLERGLYDQPRERVGPGTPQALPPMPAGLPRNRLGLARWLVDPANPLTSRVAVNRAWQTIFGAGLVRTPDDFGSRGQPPTHPELLDWLAREYADRGWNTKRLHRLLVTSATFRQSSRVTPELAAVDRDNLLLARGPRFRLPAETLRDQALAAAGLLDLQIGGESVRPYQPADLWRELAYDPNEYSAQVFVQSRGADLYRRSLYTFWKRSVPPPNLSLLDAPDRETCVAGRGRSDSPLAALVLLNDPTFVEAARHIAARVLRERAAGDAARIDLLLTLVLARPATAAERVLLLKSLALHLAEFRREPAAAVSLLTVGESPADPALDRAELAAWTMLAGTVLNLDEAVSLR